MAQNVDRLIIGKIAGNMLLGLGFANIVMALANHFGISWLTWAAAGLMAVVALLGSIRLFQINRMYGAASRGGRIGTIIGVAVTVAGVAAVVWIIIWGAAVPTVTVSDDSFHISGMYGRTVSFDDGSGLILYESSMRELGIGRRTNGYGGSETFKGYFTSVEFGAHLLFVRAGASPTIRVVIENGGDIFISFSDAEATWTLYEELSAALSLCGDVYDTNGILLPSG
jgi:hypothetical protein